MDFKYLNDAVNETRTHNSKLSNDTSNRWLMKWWKIFQWFFITNITGAKSTQTKWRVEKNTFYETKNCEFAVQSFIRSILFGIFVKNLLDAVLDAAVINQHANNNTRAFRLIRWHFCVQKTHTDANSTGK